MATMGVDAFVVEIEVFQEGRNVLKLGKAKFDKACGRC